MYLPVSATIVAEYPAWEGAIRKVDELLHENAGELVRIDFVSGFVDVPPRGLLRILEAYAKFGAIRIVMAHACPKHGQLLGHGQLQDNAAERDAGSALPESDLACDLCEGCDERSGCDPAAYPIVAAIEIVARARRAEATSSGVKAFISHSSQDKPWVRRLVDDLERHGLSVWLDERRMRIGDSIVGEINRALCAADRLIIVLSRHSVASAWVDNELEYALMAEKKRSEGMRILPIRLDDCEIPPLLRGRLYADFSRDYDVAFRLLLDGLRE
jgi:hypothetical protein